MNTQQLTDEWSFPRRHALTRGFTLGAPRNFRVSADGERVAFLRSSGPTDSVNSLWLFDVFNNTERLVVDAAEFGSDLADLPPAERARRERARESGGGIVAYDADRDLTVAVFAIGSQIARVDLQSGEVRVLDAAEGAFDPRLSPDTQKVAYVAGGELRMVTDDEDRLLIGEPEETVSWGAAEFIAAEEMGRTRGFWWGRTVMRCWLKELTWLRSIPGGSVRRLPLGRRQRKFVTQQPVAPMPMLPWPLLVSTTAALM